MTKLKKGKDQKTSLFQRISKKARIIVVNTDNYEEKRHFMLSPLNVLVLFLFFTIIVVVFTYLVIAYTPLRQFIPGVPDFSKEMVLRKIDKENMQFLDKLEYQSNVEELYFKNIATILNEETPKDPTSQESVNNRDSINRDNIDFSVSKEDSSLRTKIDLREKYELHDKGSGISQNDDMKGVFFFTPINGTVTESINIKTGHFGVDIVAPKDEAIMATLDGTVIFKDWTPENGHIIYLQHNYNLISVYKHNSFVLKKIGDVVEAGDPIAIIGNSGRLSTGPHLHFELWHKGKALNPEEYMRFN